MTGSLQIKNNRYYVVLYFIDDTGKRKQKWISTEISIIGSNKRKAEIRLREILFEFEHQNQQQILYSADMLFLDWVDKWMEQKKRSSFKHL